MNLIVNNLSSLDWQEARAAVCTRLIAVPDFTDRERKRTSWWAEGKWNLLGSVFPRIELGPPPQPALIAVESEPEGYVFAMVWKDVWNVGDNDMLHNVCMHTDPQPGPPPAKQQSRTGGIMIFSKGNRQDALRKYLELLSLWVKAVFK